jgi:hypothetical protein
MCAAAIVRDPPLDLHHAKGRLGQPLQQMQDGGLARARRAADADDVAGVDLQVQPEEQGRPAPIRIDVAQRGIAGSAAGGGAAYRWRPRSPHP